jgi:heptaprenyl diphosphate synthase
MKKTKKITVFALMIALAFTLSFLESLIPINLGIPGVKIGLANLVVLSELYLMGDKEAFAISMIRILIAGFTFSGMFALLYSFVGGILSFVVMVVAKKSKHISILGVSILGACVHNTGQIIVAGIVMQTARIIYYLPVLLLSGIIAGVVVGVVSAIIVERLSKIDFTKQ